MSDQRQGGIAWTDETWNPLRGCSRVSSGCEHCYAERTAARFSKPGEPYDGLTRNGRWTGSVALVEKHLTDPLRWKRPRRVFVNSMSDLFHESVPDEWIDRIFAVMALAPQHTFQILTKRPERMRTYLREMEERHECDGNFSISPQTVLRAEWLRYTHDPATILREIPWPLPNVWLGVSAEDQKAADERIPILLDTPAAVRWVSIEPMLGPVHLRPSAKFHFDTTPWLPRLDWVVVGGESGPGARPMKPDWVRWVRDECKEAGVSFLFKQWGEWVGGSFFGDSEGSGYYRLQNGELIDLDDDSVDSEVLGQWSEKNVVIHSRSEQWCDPLTLYSGECSVRCGKKAAGRELDGEIWDEYPGGNK